MILIHSDLAKETGSFFKVAWELLINALAGKWGKLKAIIPGNGRRSVSVAKGTFTHCFRIEWDGTGDGGYSVDEPGAELMVLVIDEAAGTTKCFEGRGKIDISLALEAQKSYFVVVFGLV